VIEQEPAIAIIAADCSVWTVEHVLGGSDAGENHPGHQAIQISEEAIGAYSGKASGEK